MKKGKEELVDMKICPQCGKENSEQAQFCEHCGYHFAEKETPAAAQTSASAGIGQRSQGTPPPKKPSSKWPLLVAGLVVAAIVIGVGLGFANKKAPQQTATTTTSSVDTAKYDQVIADAKTLSINGKHKESNMKLAAIPASDLGKPEFASVKEEVADLKDQNETGLAEQKEAEEAKKNEKTKQSQAKQAASSAGGFVGDYAKWANTYTFYYNQSTQKQSSLTISANGGVTQNNTDGTQYFGQASITGSGGSALSYVTNEQYPDSMPDTKMINPNVQITVTWDDGGGTQVYYGYLSYSSRLALTDGVDKGAGVNEVWISY